MSEMRPTQRRVGFLLGTGIVLAPYVFSWFTLRKGHTGLARGLSLGWCAIVILGMLGGGEEAPPAPEAPSASVQYLPAPSAPAPSAEPPSVASASQEEPAPESQLPWVQKVRQRCDEYDDAPNDIKKSAIFRSVERLLAKTRVSQTQGILQSLSTNQGGRRLSLTIDVGDVQFSTESLMKPIKRGTKVYAQATELEEGECVQFSARGLRASSLRERSQVCDTEYFARFTDVRPCPL